MFDHIREKVEQTRQDERAYRIYRYKHEAAPTIIAVVLYAALQALLVTAMIAGGMLPAAAAITSTAISATISYPVYAEIKTEIAADSKAFLETKKIARDPLQYKILYPHFSDEVSSDTGSKLNQSGQREPNQRSQSNRHEESYLREGYLKAHNARYTDQAHKRAAKGLWEDYLDNRHTAVNPLHRSRG